jgi:hypothetical protein
LGRCVTITRIGGLLALEDAVDPAIGGWKAHRPTRSGAASPTYSDVETIAPGYGCILRGHNVVARHYQMLDEILKRLDQSVAVSRYVFRDEER